MGGGTGGSLQKTIATCSKCETNLILTNLHRSRRHSSSQSQKCLSAIWSEIKQISSKNLINYRNFCLTQCLTDGTLLKAFLTYTASEQKTISIYWFSARSRYISGKLFRREPSGKHCWIKNFVYG